jgi:type I restriction enzyme, S subunit
LTVTHPVFGTRIPSDWTLVRVDDIRSPEPSSCVAGPFGSNISSKYFVDEGVPVIRGGNLTDDLTPFVPTGFVFVSKERAQSYRAQHVRAGDLVFTCWGTIGQVGRIPEGGPYSEYIISNKQLKLRPDPARTDSRFLYYYFANPQMVKHIKGRAIGSAVPGINLGILKALPVVLPPLLTQRKIAATLSAYDDLIENNKRRIKLLEEMAQRIYGEWFVDFRYPGHESVPLVDSKLGPIPEGWDVLPFTDVADVLSGGTPRTTEAEYWGGDIPFFTPRDAPDELVVVATEKTITERGLARCNSRLYPAGTVFITARGTVGKVAIAGVPMAMNQSCYALCGIDGGQEYVLFALLAQIQYLKMNTGGATFDTVIVDTFRRMGVPRAPAALTRKFCSTVAPMLGKVLVLIHSSIKLRAARDLLLPRLISGEMDVDDLNIEVPDAA